MVDHFCNSGKKIISFCRLFTTSFYSRYFGKECELLYINLVEGISKGLVMVTGSHILRNIPTTAKKLTEKKWNIKVKEFLLHWNVAKSRTNIFKSPYFLCDNLIKDEFHTFISLSDLFEKLHQRHIFIQSYNHKGKGVSFHYLLKSVSVTCALE